jgi:hypothetical protein
MVDMSEGTTKPGLLSREELANLAAGILDWDGEYDVVSHKENHQGGAFSDWEGIEDTAKDIVRDLQRLLGAAGYQVYAPKVRHCPPDGTPCGDCADLPVEPIPR